MTEEKRHSSTLLPEHPEPVVLAVFVVDALVVDRRDVVAAVVLIRLVVAAGVVDFVVDFLEVVVDLLELVVEAARSSSHLRAFPPAVTVAYGFGYLAAQKA